jgi:hypothetical protein
LENHDFAESITLKEALDMFKPKEEDKGRGLDEKLVILGGYINSHNVYINVDGLHQLPPQELVSIMAILSEQGIIITNWKKSRKERKEQYQTRLITEIVDSLIKAIQTRKISIPMATYTLEQIIDDYNIVNQLAKTLENIKDIVKIIGKDFDTLPQILGEKKTKEIERILQTKVGRNVNRYWRDLFPAMRRHLKANKLDL